MKLRSLGFRNITSNPDPTTGICILPCPTGPFKLHAVFAVYALSGFVPLKYGVVTVIYGGVATVFKAQGDQGTIGDSVEVSFTQSGMYWGSNYGGRVRSHVPLPVDLFLNPSYMVKFEVSDFENGSDTIDPVNFLVEDFEEFQS